MALLFNNFIFLVLRMFEVLYDVEGGYPSNHYELTQAWNHLEQAGHSAPEAYKLLLTQIGLLDKQLDDLEVCVWFYF